MATPIIAGKVSAPQGHRMRERCISNSSSTWIVTIRPLPIFFCISFFVSARDLTSQLHVIEEKFPTTLVQDTALTCQLDWICRVAPVPEVFGFDIKDVNGVVGNPCAQAVGVFRGITRNWAPHALLEGVTRTLQRIFSDTFVYDHISSTITLILPVFRVGHRSSGDDAYALLMMMMVMICSSCHSLVLYGVCCLLLSSCFFRCVGGGRKCYSRALGADDVFPLIVFLLSHIGCNTISRRLQCASEAIDACIAQVFHHSHEPLFAYYGLIDDDNTLSELRYYCTAMQVRCAFCSSSALTFIFGH